MPDYTVTVEVDTDATRARAHRWSAALAGWSPAVSSTARGRSLVGITVPAASLQQAITTGSAVLLPALAADGTDCFRVTTSAEHDRRAGEVAFPDVLGATDTARLLGLTRQRVQQMAAAGQLASVKVGGALLFSRSGVEAFARSRARDA